MWSDDGEEILFPLVSNGPLPLVIIRLFINFKIFTYLR
jgi:hypothetical protein